MENKTIEFVCTANNGRSTISRAIAQDYLVRQNLDLEYRSISSGSHADSVLAGNMPLRIKKMVIESGFRDGICDDTEFGLVKGYNLEDVEKVCSENGQYKSFFDQTAEKCRAHYSDIEEAECREVAQELGIEKFLDGNFKQTQAREDVIAVMSMGASNLKAVDGIYVASDYNPITGIISKYVLGEDEAEVQNAFSKGKDVYMAVVDQLRELVPRAIDKVINETGTGSK
jgi:protein-tyrosine-phosphatase